MDVADLGCVYNFREAGPHNARLFRMACETANHITVSGHLYVAMNGGPFLIKRKGRFRMDGGGTIEGVGSQPTVALLEVTRQGTPSLVIENLDFETDGSGIHLETPGAGTVLRDVRIEARGEGVQAYDDFTDVDWSNAKNLPRMLCSYGLWVNNADGGQLDHVNIYRCGGHGLVATRWHNSTSLVGQIHGCKGCGFKGERINGTHLNIRCESNGMFGIFMKFCCERSNMWPHPDYWHPSGSPTRMWAWVENNNGGNRETQIKLERCRDLQLDGQVRNIDSDQPQPSPGANADDQPPTLDDEGSSD